MRMPADAASEPGRREVLIVGGGLAGLSLARQLLLAGRRVLLVERRELPPQRQKVGEATVQLSGYYYSRVLEMEEHLLREHYLKYNLRFYWSPGGGAAAVGAADGEARAAGAAGDLWRYDVSYLRTLSNIATYQIDRNVFEAELLRVNLERPEFELHTEATELVIDLEAEGAGGRHGFRFRTPSGSVEGMADWVVDTSGRARVLARRLGLARPSPIRHGTSYAWVDGLVDIEALSDLDARQRRVHPLRSQLGHMPAFLATNHFCGEGFWFWVIPLHGKTSLGLVYDRDSVPREEVATPAKLIDWVCRRFPLFARDLPHRRLIEGGGFTDFALDAAQTISPARWAMAGEACRFSDPLYSPGGDLISTYNTLIVDCIVGDPAELPEKVAIYEPLARALYEAYVPSFAVSYAVLGDREVFSLRYVWELSIYFGFYVFPFVNDLFTDRRFVPGFLRRFSRLGPINRGLHELLAGFYRWKKENLAPPRTGPVLFDFEEVGHLRAARECFFRVGLAAEEALAVIGDQLRNLDDLARWIVSHVAAVTTGDERAASAAFVAAIDPRRLAFDAAALAEQVAACPPGGPRHVWKHPVPCLARFAQERLPAPDGGALGEEQEAPHEAVEMTGGLGAERRQR